VLTFLFTLLVYLYSSDAFHHYRQSIGTIPHFFLIKSEEVQMFSLLFYIRQLNAEIYQGTAWRDALISVIGLYHIHIYIHLISDNYSLYRHRTWYMHWKADTRAYIVIVTLWVGMSRILLIDMPSSTKYLTSRFIKALKEENKKWHHHLRFLWIQLFRL